MDRFRGFLFIDPSDLPIPAEAVAAMPASLAREENVMPVAIAGDVLTVAADRVADFELIDRLRFVCGLQVHTVAARTLAIRAAVARHYGEGDGG